MRSIDTVGTIIILSILVVSSCRTSRSAGIGKNEVDMGYGKVLDNSRSFPVSEHEVSEAEINASQDIFDYLRTVPGVEVGYAEAGGIPHIEVRGRRSIIPENQGEPLFLVDGVEYPTIQDLRPEDIHSVRVLKDGAAASYGSRGANGVILFKTRFAEEAENR